MFEKLKALWNVFQQGKAVANPEAWKKGQITAGLVAGALGAAVGVAKVFGYAVPLTDDQLLQVGGGVVAVVGLFNAGATVASSTKIGLGDAPVPVEVPATGSVVMMRPTGHDGPYGEA